MRILVVEDDAMIADFIGRGLKEAGHIVDVMANGLDAFQHCQTERYEAIVMDRMLPGLDGLEVVKRLRAQGNMTPVLILSSLAEVEQRVEGLRGGADDYLAKPFSLVELMARIEGLQRRQNQQATPVTRLKVADLELDLLKRSVRRDAVAIELQPREFRLLEYLMRHADQVVTRTMLLEGVWDYHFDPQTNVIDVHISRLRQKVEFEDKPILLHTIRGAGYLLGVR